MIVLIVQLAGVVAFWIATIVLGGLLRQRPEAESAEATSRASHLFFWLGMVAPWAVGFAFPGPAALDRAAGLSPLPLPFWPRVVVGAVMLVAGVVVMQLSINALGRRGHGAPAFKLTQTVVSTGVYGATRNPMALGFYVACVGGSVLSGSSYMLLYTIIGVIPAHLFNLRFFEEYELSLRYGEPYADYRRTVPFLIPRVRPRTPAAD